MPLKMKATPLTDSDEEKSSDKDEIVEKRIKLIRELSELEKPQKRYSGGIVVNSDFESNTQSASASLSAAEKKGLKEVEQLERELDLKNTFSKETNRRDEDAEMNKYIDEQIRLRHEAAKKEREKHDKKVSKETDTELAEIFTLPAAATERVEDILLHTLAKDSTPRTDEKSEAMLSSHMLNNIPEVDLGIDERLRAHDAAKIAKNQIGTSNSHQNNRTKSTAGINFSTNYQSHRANYHRDKYDLHHSVGRRERFNSSSLNEPKVIIEPVVTVGEEPGAIEYRLPSTGGERPPPKGKASDDYFFKKFKRNNRR